MKTRLLLLVMCSSTLLASALPAGLCADESDCSAAAVHEQTDKRGTYQRESSKSEPKGYLRACEEIRRGHCARARRYLQPLAQKGHAKSQTLLGLMYETGAGAEKNTQKAVGWYEKAAKQGLREAENNLGHLYLSAEESVRDPKKAEQWLNKAAEHGAVEAQHDLGLLYLHGDLVTKDHDKAVSLLRRAAEQGSADAQAVLSKIPGEPQLQNNIANSTAQSEQNFSHGLGNIEGSWEGYADLAREMHNVAAGSN